MLIPYFVSFYIQSDKSISSSSFTLMIGLAGLSESVSTMIVSQIFKYLRPYYVIVVVGTLSSVLLFLSSYIESANLICWVYGISIGSLCGGSFLPVLYILWNHYPLYKGFVLGVVLASFNLGLIPFGYLFMILINPKDLPGRKIYENGEDIIFDDEVNSEFISTIQIIAALYFVSLYIGLILLPSNTKETTVDEKIDCIEYCVMLRDFRFWNSFVLIGIGMSANQYIHNLYKVIGLKYNSSDHFNTFVGIGNSVGVAISNILFGYLLSKYNWKVIMILNYLSLAILNAGLWYMLDSPYIYATAVLISGFFGGSIYTSIVLLCENDFPKDHRFLSSVSLAIILAFFFPFILENSITFYFGYFYTFLFISLIYLVCAIQVMIHPRPKKSILQYELLVR